jgi:hypothetical protein
MAIQGIRQADDETQDVEVTPEMIEAGVAELALYRYDLGNQDEVVAAIYRAMLRLDALHRIESGARQVR